MLEQKSRRAGIGRGFDTDIIVVRCKYDYFDGRQRFEHLPGGFQTVEPGHRDVHQHHIGTEFHGQGHRFAAIRRFTNHLKIRFQFQHMAKAFAHDRVIIRQ